VGNHFKERRADGRIILNLLTISNFRLILNVVFFLLVDSLASEFHVPTFRNTLFHLHRWCKITPPVKIEQSVPKGQRIRFRHRGTTQKKEYNNIKMISIRSQGVGNI